MPTMPKMTIRPIAAGIVAVETTIPTAATSKLGAAERLSQMCDGTISDVKPTSEKRRMNSWRDYQGTCTKLLTPHTTGALDAAFSAPAADKK